MPVGAVQVGWFVNEHLTAQENGTATYVKDVDFEVLAPSELGEDEDHSEGGDFPTGVSTSCVSCASARSCVN
ncbi:MAG: hypothetical protein R2856_32885 [Caldilineaceae bacterium]